MPIKVKYTIELPHYKYQGKLYRVGDRIKYSDGYIELSGKISSLPNMNSHKERFGLYGTTPLNATMIMTDQIDNLCTVWLDDFRNLGANNYLKDNRAVEMNTTHPGLGYAVRLDELEII